MFNELADNEVSRGVPSTVSGTMSRAVFAKRCLYSANLEKWLPRVVKTFCAATVLIALALAVLLTRIALRAVANLRPTGQVIVGLTVAVMLIAGMFIAKYSFERRAGLSMSENNPSAASSSNSAAGMVNASFWLR